jgi:undecaprenyl-phosphate galactose phosphotransferase
MIRNRKYLDIAALVVVDVLSIALAVGAALLIRGIALPKLYPNPVVHLRPESITFSLWILAVWVFFLYYEGLYTKRFSFWDEMKALWKVAFFSTVAVLVIVSVGQLSHVASRGLILGTGLAALFVIPLVRINAQGFLRNHGLFRRRVLIVGAGEVGRSCLMALRREQNLGYEVIGFVDDDEGTERSVEGVKVHRGIEQVDRYIGPCNVSDIFIAKPEMGADRVEGLINKVQFMVERVLFVPDVHSIPVIGTEIHHFFHDQMFSLEIKNNLAKRYNILFKRVFDTLVSLALLLLLSLPMVFICLAIVIESPGSPLFLQTRVGRGGRPFRVYKFRTMFRDAEQVLESLLARDDKARQDWETHWKLRNDPRITKTGAFLRRTSLDELPQLINVIRGEMSLVGPRPYLPDELRSISENMRVFLNVCPGITGLWQVSGRSNTDYGYRVALDAWYVRNWSLWLDVVILLKTVKVVVRGDGAY